jgi:phosphotransferase system enzyme I (PtsI)
VLVGLGAGALTMTARALTDVRATLARHSYDECVRYAAAVLSADGPSEARARVRDLLDPG